MTQDYKTNKNLGIEAAKAAGRVKAKINKIYSSSYARPWMPIIDSLAVYHDDDLVDCVLENIEYAMTFGLPPKYFPRFFLDLTLKMGKQSQLRGKYSKGDMSSYGWLEGKDKDKGRPVWEMSEKFFTLYYDHGGSALIKGPRRSGKTLLATQDIALPWIKTYRHVVSGIYVDEIMIDGKKQKPAYSHYHYHSSMNKQLQDVLNIKIEALEKQIDEGVEHLVHPIVVDVIDEAALSKGKYRTTSDRVMQQMYIAAIAGHLGIFVVEIHPFDTAVIWVRESLTHEFEFLERGRLKATVYQSGSAVPNIDELWGFKSLEERIDAAGAIDYMKYRPYAPESYVVDVDVIAMLDFVNEQLELMVEQGEKFTEIDQWRAGLKWLKEDRESQLSGAMGISYGKMVSSLAILLVQLERYNDIMKGTDKYKPIKITQQLIERIMDDSPWPVKRNTLGEHVVKARQVLRTMNIREKAREEATTEIIDRLRAQGIDIDDEGNLINS